MIIDIPVALQSLRPNAQWHMIGTEYSNIYWDDETQTKPTEEEIEVKLVELKYQEEVNVYQEKRKLEYPDWGDQLDQIYHSGIDVWKADIKTIKDKYPKQTMDTEELKKRKDAAIFNLQKRDYEKAAARLAQHELANGVKGVVETIKIWDSSVESYIDQDITGYLVKPIPLYVEGVGRNPLIVQDETEREAAQQVINNTPQAVIDSINT